MITSAPTLMVPGSAAVNMGTGWRTMAKDAQVGVTVCMELAY